MAGTLNVDSLGESLDLSGKGLRRLDVFKDIQPKILSLKVDSNHVNTLYGINNYPSLMQLSCKGNRISDLYPLSQLRQLVILNVQNNAITTIQGLDTLRSLQWISLAGNTIKDAGGIIDCTALTHLDLSDNFIKTLPDLSRLKSLKTLLLHGNGIKSLHSSPSLPASLHTLTLAENSISDLNEFSSLSSTKSLKQLSLMGNMCTSETSNDGRLIDYRTFVLYCCPSVTVLDGVSTTDLERHQSRMLFFGYSECPFKIGQHSELIQYLFKRASHLTSNDMSLKVPVSTFQSLSLPNNENTSPNTSPSRGPVIFPSSHDPGTSLSTSPRRLPLSPRRSPKPIGTKERSPEIMETFKTLKHVQQLIKEQEKLILDQSVAMTTDNEEGVAMDLTVEDLESSKNRSYISQHSRGIPSVPRSRKGFRHSSPLGKMATERKNHSPTYVYSPPVIDNNTFDGVSSIASSLSQAYGLLDPSPLNLERSSDNKTLLSSLLDANVVSSANASWLQFQPESAQFQIGQAGSTQFLAGQPGSTQFQIRQPGSTQFLTGQPDSTQFQTGQLNTILFQPSKAQIQPDSAQFQTGQPGSTQFQTGQLNTILFQPSKAQIQPDSAQFQTGQPGSTQFQTGQLNTILFQPSKAQIQPDSAQFQTGQPGSTQFQTGQPDSTQFQTGQPDSAQFQTGQPDSAQFQTGQPDSAQFQTGQPGSTQFQTGQPDSAQFQTGQPDSAQFQTGQPGSTQFQTGQPDSAQFQTGQPGSTQFQTGQPDSAQFQTGQLDSVQFQPRQLNTILFQPSKAQLQPDSVQFQSRQLDSAQFQSRQLDSAQFQSRQLDSAQFQPRQLEFQSRQLDSAQFQSRQLDSNLFQHKQLDTVPIQPDKVDSKSDIRQCEIISITVQTDKGSFLQHTGVQTLPLSSEGDSSQKNKISKYTSTDNLCTLELDTSYDDHTQLQSHPFEDHTRIQSHPFEDHTHTQYHPLEDHTHTQSHPLEDHTHIQPHPFEDHTHIQSHPFKVVNPIPYGNNEHDSILLDGETPSSNGGTTLLTGVDPLVYNEGIGGNKNCEKQLPLAAKEGDSSKFKYYPSLRNTGPSEQDNMSANSNRVEDDDGVNKYERAAIVIQSLWRGFVCRKKELLKRHKAAVLIQAAWRGYYCRVYNHFVGQVYREMNRRKAESYITLMYLQLRGCREELAHQIGTVQIQEETLKSLLMEVEDIKKEKGRKEKLKRIKAAITIQKYWKGYLTRKVYCYSGTSRNKLVPLAMCSALKKQVIQLEDSVNKLTDLLARQLDLPSPRNLRMSHFSSSCLLVLWDPPPDTPLCPYPLIKRPNIDKYKIYINEEQEGSVSSLKTKAYIEGLDSNITYNITVTALYESGKESQPSNPVVAILSSPSSVADGERDEHNSTNLRRAITFAEVPKRTLLSEERKFFNNKDLLDYKRRHSSPAPCLSAMANRDDARVTKSSSPLSDNGDSLSTNDCNTTYSVHSNSGQSSDLQDPALGSEGTNFSLDVIEENTRNENEDKNRNEETGLGHMMDKNEEMRFSTNKVEQLKMASIGANYMYEDEDKQNEEGDDNGVPAVNTCLVDDKENDDPPFESRGTRTPFETTEEVYITPPLLLSTNKKPTKYFQDPTKHYTSQSPPLLSGGVSGWKALSIQEEGQQPYLIPPYTHQPLDSAPVADNLTCTLTTTKYVTMVTATNVIGQRTATDASVAITTFPRSDSVLHCSSMPSLTDLEHINKPLETKYSSDHLYQKSFYNSSEYNRLVNW